MKMEPAGLPVQIFHNLMDAYKDNLSTWHRYWDVKRRRLGYSTLHPYDIWAPIVDNPPQISFDQAVEWICEALRPLGNEYVAILRKGCLEDGWVERGYNLNKAQTAFSCPSFGGSLPYVLVHYDDSVLEMSTLTHELGHSMNHYFIGQNQPLIYNSTTFNPMYTFTIAETHSNFHQAMARAYLRKVKGDDEPLMLAVIDAAMSNFHRYFFLMLNIAQFEYEVHNRVSEGKPVSAATLMEIMSGFMAEGYGDTMQFDPSYEGLVWVTLSHVFNAFYSFQYAIGISAAHAIADDILAGKEGAVERYLEFAALGTSKDALESFDVAGVDMRTRKPIDKAFAVLSDLVDQLEALVS